ncbi:MAG: FAD-dependent oxidoreductase, partial [Anaerolineae bacterium]|nr:FAD-dependent oxidoreductase [Anaerolineae bacterium]
ETDKIKVLYNTEVKAFEGRRTLEGVEVYNKVTGQTDTLHPKGVFVFIGLSPNTKWLPETIRRDGTGFIETDLTLMTSLPGVFAAGDARQGSTKQAASAAGEGATAALMMREYLKGV